MRCTGGGGSYASLLRPRQPRSPVSSPVSGCSRQKAHHSVWDCSFAAENSGQRAGSRPRHGQGCDSRRFHSNAKSPGRSSSRRAVAKSRRMSRSEMLLPLLLSSCSPARSPPPSPSFLCSHSHRHRLRPPAIPRSHFRPPVREPSPATGAKEAPHVTGDARSCLPASSIIGTAPPCGMNLIGRLSMPADMYPERGGSSP